MSSRYFIFFIFFLPGLRIINRISEKKFYRDMDLLVYVDPTDTRGKNFQNRYSDTF
jgi:hypothetical protein